ncbi:(S)-benzoin forming benzil reductase [Oceanobacillus senegalensis]|uniref:(S)-benzoin forming benzil reductase n=1 Tax=Oceanobacillus senegalensis TaxID=1936063 RepID=UPI000A30C73F|nr:(S)-benzoin forming benzil reductase [Oceanobacillus senegalensis]
MTKFAIVTGESKGLGEGIATLFLESGVSVIGISRSENHQLPVIAEKNNQLYKHFRCDLSDPNEVQNTFNNMKDFIASEKELTNVFLVNNAAAVKPINQAMNIKSEDLVRHVQINMVAPMLLTNLFLNEANAMDVPAIAVMVTSGAAERPIYGWSAYCSTKASMNMYTKTVALEQEELETGNKVIAFNPGVMDTEMQETIRSSTKEQFSDVERYQDLKENSQLNPPKTVASVLIDILNDEDVGNGKVYNVKNYL